ncbi:MAG: mandelate racemase/muconate lactonizing enzyme family protein [Alphaproteobacteria bacterium]|nr:mandelate racemase/muconate lactonizing enzyme family protein [Alphaproteobacteria bacterium]MDP6516321.1 mandelate racemase/muconate lactonizing enzyme family protein [Alphaproteobacteria bacterium]
MKITRIEDLHCDAGWRNFSFLKISTDAGIVGYSEYNESYGSAGLTATITALGETLIGQDPRPIERIVARLHGITRHAPGGINQQAIAALENALLDVKAKDLGIPVYQLLGGAVRPRLQLYWSHCGTYRLAHHAVMGKPPLRTLDDVVALGREAKQSGFAALKTNIFLLDVDPPVLYMPGFGNGPGAPALNAEKRVIDALDQQLAAFRQGAGPDVALILDLNFNFKTEGFLQVTRALDNHGLMWFEIDSFDAAALGLIRRRTSTPIASCESLYGRRAFLPYFEHQAMDVAIVDAPWNGVLESVKIAAMAEAWEVNVAPHNFYGHLSTLMSAHFCAALPNFRIMEIDVDDVPWKDDLVSTPPVIEDGHLVLPRAPGWGAEVNEEAVRAHPPKR